jgi:hypothetical protein|tara:strand:+ start:2197 stop:3261 length:1065 start_codon:yes stop_codon:yes gene_type:complete
MHYWLLIGLVSSSIYADIGSISELRGNGEVLRSQNGDKLLAELSLGILSNDDVRTGNGRMAIQFLDDSVIKLTERSRIVVDEYIYDPNPSKSKLALRMASGTARFITGKLGKIDKKNVSIKTPSATVSVLGTDFTTTVDEIGRSLVILLPDEDGNSSGIITVETAAGIEILDKPFQATMVSVSEAPPTKPVTLVNMTLGLINNLLIINPPDEVEQAIEDQNARSSNVLDVDFLEENFDEDELEEDELEIDRLSIDLLSVDFLIDLLAFIEGEEEISRIGDVTIEGIRAGYDQKAQVYSYVDGEMLTFYRSVENTIDLQIEKTSAYNIQILSAGKFIDITVNGGGDGTIIINQSD